MTTTAKKPGSKVAAVFRSLCSDTYAIWVLILCTAAFANNQLNRYVLGSVAAGDNGLEIGVGFGDGDGTSFLVFLCWIKKENEVVIFLFLFFFLR